MTLLFNYPMDNPVCRTTPGKLGLMFNYINKYLHERNTNQFALYQIKDIKYYILFSNIVSALRFGTYKVFINTFLVCTTLGKKLIFMYIKKVWSNALYKQLNIEIQGKTN